MKISLKILLWAIVGFSQLTLKSQTNAIAKYQYHSFGGFEMETKLIINEDESWYSHYQDRREWTNNGINFEYIKNYYDWYLDLGDKKVTMFGERENFPPLQAFETPSMSWDIKPETKTINGYKVQKATRKSLIENSYLGDVVAWFSVELPFSTGPDGYYGLPGLIIKIEYTKMKSMYTILKEIDLKNYEEIKLKKNIGIKVSPDQFFNPEKIDKKWLKEQKKTD